MNKRDDLKMQLEEVESRLVELYDKEERTPEETAEMRTLCDDVDSINAELDAGSRAEKAIAGIRKPQGERPKMDEPGEVQKFAGLGQYMQAVAAASKPWGETLAGMPTGHLDPRLSGPQASTGLAESTPSLGGFLVQEDFSSQLLEAAHAQSVLYPKTRKLRLSSNANSIKIPGIDETSRADGSRWGGIRAYWEGEGATLTASSPKFRNVEMSLKKLTGLVYVTDEMLQDSSILEGVIRAGFEEEFSFKIDDAIMWGTGAGQPLGIQNADCLVPVTGASSADTIVAADITASFARMYPGSLNRAQWFTNVDCVPQLMATTLGDSPLWLPNNSLAGSPHGTILGKNVDFIEQASTVGDVGDLNFFDLSQYLVLEKGGMQAAASMHVQFLTDEMVFRFIIRMDGQPAWHSALTPYKGTNTQSPFVTVATRT